MTKATKSPENCRHEYVRIYQRRLKGLERRLVATRAYLPVGFKITDFSHLSEGSFCFCAHCRTRLYPKRTNQEKLAARLANQQAKLEAAQGLLESSDLAVETESDDSGDTGDKRIAVEELELDALELDEIADGGVDTPEEDE